MILPASVSAFSIRQGTRFDPVGHTYWNADGDEVPGTTAILKEMGIVDDRWFKEFHTRRGSAVHAAIELQLKGEIEKYDIDPVSLPYLKDFRAWQEDTQFQPVHIEQPFVSEHNYGTTPDILGYFKKGNTALSLVEIKTGQAPPWVRLQTAAQQIAAMEVLGKPITERFILKLKNGEGYHFSPIPVQHNHQDRLDFLSLITAYYVRRKYGYK